MQVDHGSLADGMRHGRRLPYLFLIMAATLTCSGCTLFRSVNDYIQYNDGCDEFVLAWRNDVWSSQAWRARQHMFADRDQFYAFGEGFRDGYKDVASGSDGCPPAIPPRRYWSYSFQTPEGQAKVAAWFAGYPYGVQAAREDGAAGYRDIQIAGTTGAQYSNAFNNGECPTCQETHLAPAEGSAPETIEGTTHPALPLPNSLIVPRVQPGMTPPTMPNGWPGPGI
jgi:hypothetical protein